MQFPTNYFLDYRWDKKAHFHKKPKLNLILNLDVGLEFENKSQTS